MGSGGEPLHMFLRTALNPAPRMGAWAETGCVPEGRAYCNGLFDQKGAALLLQGHSLLI